MDFLANTKSFLKFWNIYCFKTSLQRNGLPKNRVWKGGRHRNPLKNGGRWLWKMSDPSWKMDNYQMEKIHSYGKTLVVYDPYIIYSIHLNTYHIHCSIIRLISCFMWSFPSLPICACRPHLQVTPLGGRQEWWATLFTGLVLETSGSRCFSWVRLPASSRFLFWPTKDFNPESLDTPWN